MSLPRWTETLTEYAQLIDIPDDIAELSNKEILFWQFEQFMKDVDYSFQVFDTKELNDELLKRFNRLFFLNYFNQQVSGSCSPEWLFKMHFEKVFQSNIDRYNGKLRIQLKSLKEIEDVLFQNYDLKTEFEQNVNEKELIKNTSTNRLENERNTDGTEKLDTTRTKDTTDNTEGQTDKTRNKDTNKKDRTFNREIFDDTPNGQLNLTSNDGSGIISTATNITENLETATNDTNENDVEKTTDSKDRIINENEKGNNDRTTNEKETGLQTRNGTSDNDKTSNEDLESLRHITGYQNLGSKPKLLEEYSSIYQNTLKEFVNCFDKLFRYVY